MLYMSEGGGLDKKDLLSARVFDGDSVRIISPRNLPKTQSVTLKGHDYSRSDDTTRLVSYTTNVNSIPAWSYTWHNYPPIPYNDCIYIIKSYYQRDSLLKTDTSAHILSEGKTEFAVPYDYDAALLTTSYEIYAVVKDKAVVPNYVRYPASGNIANLPFVHSLLMDPLLNNNRYIYEEMFLNDGGEWQNCGSTRINYSGQITLSNRKYLQVYKNSEIYSYRRYDTLKSQVFEALPDIAERRREVLDLAVGDTAEVYRGNNQYTVKCNSEMPAESYGLFSIEKSFSAESDDSLSYTYKYGIGLIQEEYYGELNGFPRKRKSVLRYARIGSKEFGDSLFLTGTNEDAIKQTDKEMEFLVYPNPARDIVFVETETSRASVFEMRIYNSNGELVQSHVMSVVSKGKRIFEVDLRALPNGVYFLQIRGDDRIEYKKIVVVK